MGLGKILGILLAMAVIFFTGYYVGCSNIPKPEITHSIEITKREGELRPKPVEITLKDGSIFTDTIKILKYETLPDPEDTIAVYDDYFTRRTYNRTFGTDSTYTLKLTTTVVNNRIEAEQFDETYRKLTTIERYTDIKTPTKLGISASAPFKAEWIQVNAHILFKQKIDLSIGYNSKYKGVFSIGYYF